MKFIPLLFIFIISTFWGIAQDQTNKGKDFWIPNPEHVDGSASAMGLYITSDLAATGVIMVGAISIPFTVSPNNVVYKFLGPNGAGAAPNNGVYLGGYQDNVITGHGIHITSTSPVVVFAHIIKTSRSGATLVLPTTVWGKEYIVPSFANSGNTASYPEIDVYASKPNTIIEITPTTTTRNLSHPVGVSFQVTLPNVGDIYQLQFSNNSDPSGTKVKSISSTSGGCSPIAVFSATTWSGINCTGSSGGDNFLQQLFPVSAWGKEFLTSPLKKIATNNGDNNVDIIRVFVKDPLTVVTKTEAGVTTTLTGLTANNYYQYATFRPTFIQSDKPIQVVQYITSQSCGNPVTLSDPEMIVLNAVEQTINDITVFSAHQNYVPPGQSAVTTHYINVIMNSNNTSLFRINNLAPNASFIPIPNTNYSYLKEDVSARAASNPVFHLSADSGFSAIAYGFGSVESYGYNAGTNVKDLYQQVGVYTQYGIETSPSVCTGSPFKFKISLPYQPDSMYWDFHVPIGMQPNSNNIMVTSPIPDSTNIINGKTIYWYSIPTYYNFNTIGSYPVTITTYVPNGECGTTQDIDFSLEVSNPPIADFISFNSGCVAETVQFNDNTSTVKPTYLWQWNFGDPASGVNNTSTIKNPTHLYTSPGQYTVTYSNITVAGCISNQVQHIINVNPLPTATISGNTTVCINTVQPDITFTASGGTAPYTFSYHINNGAIQTINTNSGNSITLPVPTNTVGTYTYSLDSVKNTGSTLCNQYQTGSVVVNVTSDATLALTSAASTSNQTLCINNTITPIKYLVAGGGNGAIITGLPTGISGTYNLGVVTISGSPTQFGIYNYTVTTTGTCQQTSLTGTITVTGDATISLSSANSTINQNICINTNITDIVYTLGGGANNATVSGLPTGLTGSYNAGIFTISGTPTQFGTFNYTVNTLGICAQTTTQGVIIVSPDATLALTSIASTVNQNLCLNNTLTNITYSISGGGTGATVTGLPTGINAIYNAGVLTISGNPTEAGTFNYLINTTGTCLQKSAAGTIIVSPNATVTLTSSINTTTQELCANIAIADITYSIAGGATGATVIGLPTGLTGIYNAGIFTISGTATTAGVFNYTVSTTGNCVQAAATGTIIINDLPTADFNYTNPICQLRDILFTSTSTVTMGTINNLQWNFGDGNSGSGSPINHTFSVAGNNTVTLITTSSKGCVSNPIASKQVQINPKPLAGYIIPEVCLSDTYAQFLDSSKVALPNSITNWAWNFSDVNATGANPNTSTLKNPTHSFTAVGQYPVQLIATTNVGCKDTITQNLMINGSFPVANFSVNNIATLCSGDSVAIVNNSTVFPGSITKIEIYWDNTNMPTVFQTDDYPVIGKIYKFKYPSFQTPISKVFTIRFRAYSGGVCVNDKVSNITVNAMPKVQFNAIPDVCFNSLPFQITQASEIAGVPGTFIYSGVGVSSTGVFSPSVAGIGNHIIKYTFTSLAAGCVDSLSNSINVLDTASAKFSFSNPTCIGGTTLFTDNSTAPNGINLNNTVWDFGDGTSIENHTIGSSFNHIFSSANTFNVKMYNTSSYGCKSKNLILPVIVNPIPTSSFTFGETSVCLPNALVSFINNSTITDGTTNSLTYLWDFGDAPSGILNNSFAKTPPAHLYNSLNTFNVKLSVTSGVGCTKDSVIPITFIHPQPKANFSFSKPTICIGQNIVLNDLSNGMDGTINQWFWKMGDGVNKNTQQVQYTFADTLTYNVSLYTINNLGCISDTVTKPFVVNAYPTVDAGVNQFILEGGTATLNPIVTGNDLQYLWSPSTYLNSTTILQPMAINMLDDITYTLLVTGRGGCVAPTDNVFIKILKFPKIPNTFTPNGDGINETWIIDNLYTYPNCKVQVFTRTGQLVFQSIGYATPWDGKLNGKILPFDTYYYIIEPGNGRKPFTGYVTIVK